MSPSALPLRLVIASTAIALAALPQPARAYALLGGAWKTGNVTMRLQLDATAPTSPALPLTDGSTSWNAVAQSAIDEWNTTLVRSKLVGEPSTSKDAKLDDNANNIFFSPTIYDSEFDSQTLAVTLVDHYDDVGISTVQTKEADLIVNAKRQWNSYRGRNQSNPLDLRRVLLHELGHVLGLDHPDLLVPAQVVTAIMNSTISSLETLQADDRNGVNYLYNTPLVVPMIVQHPTSQTATVGTRATLGFTMTGGTPPAPVPALLSYKWYFQAPGATTFEKLFTVDSPTLDFGVVQLSDAGRYYVEITTPDSTVTSDTVSLTVNAVGQLSTTSLANLSTRGTVPAASDSSTSAMIVGFVVTGSSSKRVLIRSVGPTLATYGVSGTLGDPKLSLKNAAGTEIASSPVVWDSASDAATLRSTMASVGAFALPAGSKDAVILATLPPGGYTAQTTSPSGASGVVLVEAYDADASPSGSRLANLSTRGYTGTGGNLLIAGFVVTGPGPRTYLIRVSGSTLGTYGVTNTLPDPYLKLFNNASAATPLRETDDWDSPAATQATLRAAFTAAGAFEFKERNESAMLVTLPPGNYTAQASGNDNQQTNSATGNTLIEIYEMP